MAGSYNPGRIHHRPKNGGEFRSELRLIQRQFAVPFGPYQKRPFEKRLLQEQKSLQVFVTLLSTEVIEGSAVQ